MSDVLGFYFWLNKEKQIKMRTIAFSLINKGIVDTSVKNQVVSGEQHIERM